jgi:hypothetical protein
VEIIANHSIASASATVPCSQVAMNSLLTANISHRKDNTANNHCHSSFLGSLTFVTISADCRNRYNDPFPVTSVAMVVLTPNMLWKWPRNQEPMDSPVLVNRKYLLNQQIAAKQTDDHVLSGPRNRLTSNECARPSSLHDCIWEPSICGFVPRRMTRSIYFDHCVAVCHDCIW